MLSSSSEAKQGRASAEVKARMQAVAARVAAEITGGGGGGGGGGGSGGGGGGRGWGGEQDSRGAGCDELMEEDMSEMSVRQRLLSHAKPPEFGGEIPPGGEGGGEGGGASLNGSAAADGAHDSVVGKVFVGGTAQL